MIGGVIVTALLLWWGIRALRGRRAFEQFPHELLAVRDMLVVRHKSDLHSIKTSLLPDEGHGHFTVTLHNGTSIEYDLDGHELRRTSLNGEHL